MFTVHVSLCISCIMFSVHVPLRDFDRVLSYICAHCFDLGGGFEILGFYVYPILLFCDFLLILCILERNSVT